MSSEPLTAREVEMLQAACAIGTDRIKGAVGINSAGEKQVAAMYVRADFAERLLYRTRENARFALRCYMELLSIKHAQARWADGFEYALWKAVTEGAVKVTAEEVEKLKVLSAEAGGWWRVPEETDEPEFASTDDWQARYDDWRTE